MSAGLIFFFLLLLMLVPCFDARLTRSHAGPR